jgi:hypothetical protein
MTTDRHTITIYDPELFSRLEMHKGKYDSWDAVIDRLVTLAENNLIPSNSKELKPVAKKATDEAASLLNKIFAELWAWIIEQPKTQGWKAYKLGVKDVQFLKAQLKKHGLEKMKHFYKCACNDKFLQENNVPLSLPNMFSDKAIAKWLIIKDSAVSRRDEILKKKNEETLAYLNSLHGTTTKAVATPHYENLKDLPVPLTEEEENAKYYHQAEDYAQRCKEEQKKEMDAAYPYKPLIADKPVNPVGFQTLGELF